MNKLTVTVGTHKTIQDLLSYIRDVKHLYKRDRLYYRVSIVGWYFFEGKKTSFTYVMRPLVHDSIKIRDEIRKRNSII